MARQTQLPSRRWRTTLRPAPHPTYPLMPGRTSNRTMAHRKRHHHQTTRGALTDHLAHVDLGVMMTHLVLAGQDLLGGEICLILFL